MNIAVGTFEEVRVRGWHATAYFLWRSIAPSEDSSGGEGEEEESVCSRNRLQSGGLGVRVGR